MRSHQADRVLSPVVVQSARGFSASGCRSSGTGASSRSVSPVRLSSKICRNFSRMFDAEGEIPVCLTPKTMPEVISSDFCRKAILEEPHVRTPCSTPEVVREVSSLSSPDENSLKELQMMTPCSTPEITPEVISPRPGREVVLAEMQVMTPCSTPRTMQEGRFSSSPDKASLLRSTSKAVLEEPRVPAAPVESAVAGHRLTPSLAEVEALDFDEDCHDHTLSQLQHYTAGTQAALCACPGVSKAVAVSLDGTPDALLVRYEYCLERLNAALPEESPMGKAASRASQKAYNKLVSFLGDLDAGEMAILERQPPTLWPRKRRDALKRRCAEYGLHGEHLSDAQEQGSLQLKVGQLIPEFQEALRALVPGRCVAKHYSSGGG